MKTMSQRQTENEARVARISKHPFLKGLSYNQLALLADCALTAVFKSGEIIFRQGEKARLFYLIENGKVVLESSEEYGEPVVIETISAGDLLGWSWMLPPYAWQFTARAVLPTQVIYFASTILRDYCEKDHSLGFQLHKRISEVMMKRLQAARRKMLSINWEREKLPPIGVPPFMEQEFDTPEPN